MAKRRQLSPVEEWGRNHKRNDIPALMQRMKISLRSAEEGYVAYIDGFEIAKEDSPSKLRKKVDKVLHRLITSPGSTAKIEGFISMDELAGKMKGVIPILKDKLEALEREERQSMPKRKFNALFRARISAQGL